MGDPMGNPIKIINFKYYILYDLWVTRYKYFTYLRSKDPRNMRSKRETQHWQVYKYSRWPTVLHTPWLDENILRSSK